MFLVSCNWSLLQVLAPGLIRRAAVRLGVFAYLLFMLSSGVDGYFEGQALPDQLTARNITITLRTVVRGLSYLMTFLFAANTVGLTGEIYPWPHGDKTSHAWYGIETLQPLLASTGNIRLGAAVPRLAHLGKGRAFLASRDPGMTPQLMMLHAVRQC